LFRKPAEGLTPGAQRPKNGDVNITSGVVAVVTAAAAFGIGAFARPAGAATPPAEMFPVLAVLVLLESVAFGTGVAYLLRRRRMLLGPGTAPAYLARTRALGPARTAAR
jgi:hypothetical protein